MINPIVIIITVSVLLSVLIVCVINRPKKPFMTGTMILVLIFYCIVTFVLDNAITGMGIDENFDGFVNFLVMNASPSYEELADSFKTFMYIDITLIIAALVSLFGEIMLILRKDYRK